MCDVLIIGGGVIGCAIARQLSSYKLSVVLAEKNNDVGDVTSCANSAIVHSGYDPVPGSLKAKMNVLGNSLYPQLVKDLDVPFMQNGSLTVATSEEDMKTLEDLAKRSKENGVPCEIIDAAKLQEMEPNLNKNLVGALFAPTCGIVNPFELTVALMENAMDNGAKLLLNHEVTAIEKVGDQFAIAFKDGSIMKAKVVINAAGVYSDKINHMYGNDTSFEVKARKGEYYVLDHFNDKYVNRTIFMVPSSKGKGVLISPTTSGNYIIGPSSEWVDDKEDVSTNRDVLNYVKEQGSLIKSDVAYNQLIREYAGLRAISSNGDFIIEGRKDDKAFINVAGIQSPGLASAPAIALEVAKLVGNVLPLEANPNFNPKRRPVVRFKYLSADDKNKVIKENPLFGHIVCRCEKISEAEIIDCIHRNCGATTVKGVKKRCRPGFGKCQGGMCEPQVISILARELAKKKSDICYANLGTNICKYETKVGDKNDK